MKKANFNLPPFCLIFLIPLINIFYPFLNNASRGVNYLVTDIDRNIPFIKLFAIPYFIWYLFVPASLVYIYFINEKNYYKVISSVIIGMLLSFIIYYFFQTTVPRPSLTGNDFLTNLLRFIYTMDSPYNCFPSIHVLTCYLMIKGTQINDEKNQIGRIIVAIIAVAIILSTQFIKQHVILDLISGILLGEIIYRFVCSFNVITLKKIIAFNNKLLSNISKAYLKIRSIAFVKSANKV